MSATKLSAQANCLRTQLIALTLTCFGVLPE